MSSASNASTDELSGRQLADGKYAVGDLIGRGAMGDVYSAVHTPLQRRVAIKVLNPAMMQQPEAAERFRREALAASRIDHPHSMKILDFGQEGEFFYIVMEFLEGISLGKLIHTEGALDEKRLAGLMIQALSALARAHDEGIIHRDLKPDNIVITQTIDDEGHTIESTKVCDFGIAKINDPAGGFETLTNAGSVSGTPQYMSPEQGRGQKIDSRSDLYSCGVILYRMATGITPFSGDNALAIIYKHVSEDPPPPRSVREELSADMETVILKAMAKSPDNRYQTAREFRNALREAVGGALLSTTGQLPLTTIPPDGRQADGSTRRNKKITISSAETMIDGPAADPGTLAMPQGADIKIRHRGEETETGESESGKKGVLLGALGVAAAILAGVVFMLAGKGDDKPQPSVTGAAVAAAGASNSAKAAADESATKNDPAAAAKKVEAEAAEKAKADEAHKAEAASAGSDKPGKTPEPAGAAAADPAAADNKTDDKDDDAKRARIARRRARRAQKDPSEEKEDKNAKEAGENAAIEAKPAPKPEPKPTPKPAAKPARVDPKPAPPPPPPPPKALNFDAAVAIEGLKQRGSLSKNALKSALKRLPAASKACYKKTASAAKWAKPTTVVKVSLEIDEDGSAGAVKVNGGPPGLAACIKGHARKIRSRDLPDTGIVEVSFNLRFTP